MPIKDPLAKAARNERRRAQAAIKRYESVINDKKATRNEKQLARTAIKNTEKAIKGTYKSRTHETQKEQRFREQSVAMLKGYTDTSTLIRGKYGASNFMTQTQINIASRTYRDAEGKIDKEANPSIYSTDLPPIFYRATQAIWQAEVGATDTKQINEALFDYFKTRDLKKIVEMVMNSPMVEIALKISRGELDVSALTPEQRAYYEREKKTDSEQTNERYEKAITAAVIQFDKHKLWKDYKQEFKDVYGYDPDAES